ncbi:hypothetical protein T492DRAFT_843790 [Pavlovales sp. CCMP2436]|nr:hypothetical protein T492DRAFT_843790 [Pavlovales sp. CCMP2436]
MSVTFSPSAQAGRPPPAARDILCFRTGTWVVSDYYGWLGRVDSWEEEVEIEGAGGARVLVQGATPTLLRPSDPAQLHAPYFPQMRVRVLNPELLRLTQSGLATIYIYSFILYIYIYIYEYE